MSHQHEGAEVQGTGFFGFRDGCAEMTTSIPDRFRLTMQGSIPILGTSLAIAGFMEAQDWRRRVATSVIENYFYAIDRGQLKVFIEPDDDGDFEIADTTLGNWFAKLLDSNADSEDEQAEGVIPSAKLGPFGRLQTPIRRRLRNKTRTLVTADFGFASKKGCRVEWGSSAAQGMLVTTQQRNLIRFPSFRDFAALCVFEDPTGRASAPYGEPKARSIRAGPIAGRR